MTLLEYCLKLYGFSVDEKKALRLESRDLVRKDKIPYQQAVVQVAQNHVDELRGEAGEIEEVLRKHLGAAEEVEILKPDLVAEKKAGIDYKMDISVIDEAGETETVTVTKDAAVALRETEKELSRYEKFLNCLKS